MSPSPDQSAYSTLTLFDRSPYELAQRALIDAAVKMPGWSPRAADPALAIIEAISLVVAEEVFAINRLPNAFMDIMARNFGIERLLGTPAQATATFYLADNLGHTIPDRAVVRLSLDDATSVDFYVNGSTVVAPGQTEVSLVNLVATRAGTLANGTPGGTRLQVISPLGYVERVELDGPPHSGTDPESDEEWRSRVITRLDRLTDSLVVAKDFQDRVLEDPVVYRASTKDTWHDGATALGHITIAVADDQGEPLVADDKTRLTAELQAQTVATLAVHLVDPTYTAIAVAAPIHVVAGWSQSPEDVGSAVAGAVSGYLSPAAWSWSATVRRNELISLVDQVPGVDYVGNLTLGVDGGALGTADITLTGDFPLTRPGTITAPVI